MYINVESVEIETIDGKKSKQTVVASKRQGSKPQIPGQLDIKVRTAVAWQSLNKVNNIWKSDFAEKKGGSYSEQLRGQFSFTGVTLALWQRKKPGWNLYKNAGNGSKHI